MDTAEVPVVTHQAQQYAAVRPAVNFGDERLPSDFWERLSPCPVGGCWHWTGYHCRAVPVYYPLGARNNTRLSARRIAYQAFFGDVGRKALQSNCTNDSCCNPLHTRVPEDRDAMKRRLGKEWASRNKHKWAFYHRKVKYGITKEQYLRKKDEQGGRCEICREVFVSDIGRGSGRVDHCHTSKAVRGLLCETCNLGLGLFRDRPDLLASAIAYLQRHNVESEGE